MAYQFIDANGSILTADSSVISGSGITGTQRPILAIGSFLSALPLAVTGNHSVSGTIGSSIIGTVPVTQTTSPWAISGSVASRIIGGVSSVNLVGVNNVSVSGNVGITGRPSVSGTVNIGNLPANQSISGTVQTDVRGSVATVIIGGSVAVATGNSSVQVLNFPAVQDIAGSVAATVTNFPTTQNVSGSVVTRNTIPSSLLVGASIIGLAPVAVSNFPTTQNVSGSVAAQLIGANTVSIVGNVGQVGTIRTSISGVLLDSENRLVTSPFVGTAQTSVRGVVSIVNSSMTTLIADPGAGSAARITDLFVANSGSVATIVTVSSGGQILARTIAPAGGGSNIVGLNGLISAPESTEINVQANPAVSILYVNAYGFTES